jgi:Lon-like protease
MIETDGNAPGDVPVVVQGSGTQLSRRSIGWLIALFVGIALGALMSLVPIPYAILQPGPITNTLGDHQGKPLIAIAGSATFPTSGALDFTTVAVLGGPKNPVNVWEWLIGHLDGTSQVLPEEQLFPKGVTSTQVDEVSRADMANSQQDAVAVALRGLGQKVTEIVTIADLTKDSPAKGVLRAGDVLVSVDGKPVDASAAVIAAVRAHKGGESVAFTVRRGGEEQVLTVKTVASKGPPVVGVFLRTAFIFPTKVTIDAGDIGGPSAGMMFALAVYDKLTPGALTGGANIAGTGTIDPSGNVGPIGGIAQKLLGAQRGGATWFLAPAGNCAEVVGHIPEGVRVVKVANFTQALSAVEAIAAKKATSLPSCD